MIDRGKSKMGKQFRFIMDDIDQEKLIQKVREKGIILYNDRHNGIKEVSSLPDGNWIHLHFIKYKDTKIIQSGGKLLDVDVLRMPVLELRQSFIRYKSREIQRGRLYFENRYYRNDNLIIKDEEIEKWYKEIIQWIKNELKCVEIVENEKLTKEYVSASLAEYIKAGVKLMG